jgi:hypothetical protein
MAFNSHYSPLLRCSTSHNLAQAMVHIKMPRTNRNQERYSEGDKII